MNPDVRWSSLQLTVGVALQHAALEIKTSWRFFQADAVRTRWRAGRPLAVLPLSFASKGCTS